MNATTDKIMMVNIYKKCIFIYSYRGIVGRVKSITDKAALNWLALLMKATHERKLQPITTRPRNPRCMHLS